MVHQLKDLYLVQPVGGAVAANESDDALADDLDGNPMQVWHTKAQRDLPAGRLFQHLAHRILGGQLGRLLEVASTDMNMNTFLSKRLQSKVAQDKMWPLERKGPAGRSGLASGCQTCRGWLQLLKCTEQGMDPSVGEPPVHHKPGGCDRQTQFPVHCAGANRGRGAVGQDHREGKTKQGRG